MNGMGWLIQLSSTWLMNTPIYHLVGCVCAQLFFFKLIQVSTSKRFHASECFHEMTAKLEYSNVQIQFQGLRIHNKKKQQTKR